MTAPEQHAPPVYAVSAGAVLHAHAADTLEPAVLLHTFLPASVGDSLDAEDARVDVHGDGAASGTVTVRVLAEGRSLSWQLPIAPFVAALPGQPGDSGRMVLLGIVDAEPEPGFWAAPMDCERLAAELQLPVADLVDALRGRLTPWLADDLEVLLHDDAHDHAADRSPAQTLAAAVLAQYSGDLTAEQSTSQLVRALELAPEEFQTELGNRLCAALAAAVAVAGPATVATVLAATGPFESEVLRLLSDLPPALVNLPPGTAEVEAVTTVLLESPDLDETVRAAVSTVSRLARAALGPGLDRDQLLQRLGMVDDAALARLAGLWVRLAAAAAGAGTGDAAVVREVAAGVAAAGVPGARWLTETARALAEEAVRVAGRNRDRLAVPLEAVRLLLEDVRPPGQGVSAQVAAPALHAGLELARFARARGGVGPGAWLQVPAPAAAAAVGAAVVDALDPQTGVELFSSLLDKDVEGADVLEGFVCATAQLLAELEPEDDPAVRRAQVAELLSSVPGGPRGARWLLAACLRAAPGHDPVATDLTPFLPAEPAGDPDRAAHRAGRTGVLAAGLVSLEALARVLGPAAAFGREELVGAVLPAALAEHDLLRRTGTV